MAKHYDAEKDGYEPSDAELFMPLQLRAMAAQDEEQEIERLREELTAANGLITTLTDTVTQLTGERDRALAELRGVLDTWEKAW